MKQDREEAVTLEILQAIEGRSDVTQRHLADRAGIALGLANSYLRRCVRKGLIKITQAPANRYLYYLTPMGFAEKSRLTAEFFASSFSFYRTASESIAESLKACSDHARRRIVFCGVSELAEIGFVRAHDFGIHVVGSFDPQTTLTKFVGKPVWTSVEEIPATDAAVFTALVAAPVMYEILVANFDPDAIVVPDIVQQLVGASAES
jgi:DNA-binding MarR family transcriptional regulator